MNSSAHVDFSESCGPPLVTPCHVVRGSPDRTCVVRGSPDPAPFPTAGLLFFQFTPLITRAETVGTQDLWFSFSFFGLESVVERQLKPEECSECKFRTR
jgi:hypothetical protein